MVKTYYLLRNGVIVAGPFGTIAEAVEHKKKFIAAVQSLLQIGVTEVKIEILL